jgi:dolichyl-phosphate beta-glucosyltransferase
MAEIALVIPFFNERSRLKVELLTELSQRAGASLDIYLVDDGSTDGYGSEIRVSASILKLNNVQVISSKINLGKAEAIRFGANKIVLANYKIFGIADADFSANPEEIMRLAEIAMVASDTLVFGARVDIGTNLIETSSFRYAQGLLFNKLVTFILGYKFLDSQCGLKFFPVNTELVHAFERPFINRWLFDLEILLRLNKFEVSSMNEVVLHKWTHTKESKTSFRDLGPILVSLILLRLRYGKIDMLAQVK